MIEEQSSDDETLPLTISPNQSLITTFFNNKLSNFNDLNECNSEYTKRDLYCNNTEINTTDLANKIEDVEFDKETVFTDTLDMDIAKKRCFNKGRIIRDQGDYEINHNSSKVDELKYSITNYVNDNSLWVPNSEDNIMFGEDKLSVLSKFKYLDKPDISIAGAITRRENTENISIEPEPDHSNEEKNYYLSCNASRTSRMFREYIENYYMYSETFSFPPWIQPTFIRDSDGRRPDSADYNPSTLMIPSPDHKWSTECRSTHYTPTMKQYWSIKSSHFDKLVFFKMGRFYEIFYIDACIAHQICDLRWMGKESKPHIGFPEQSLGFYSTKLVGLGYKVVVVEQMETPKEMLEKTKRIKNSEKIISREVCQILSKGTLVNPLLDKESQPLLSIVFNNDLNYNFCACLIDLSTNKINLSHHFDDESRQYLKTLLITTNPSEILYLPNNVDKKTIDIFKRLSTRPQLSHYELKQIDDLDKGMKEKLFNDETLRENKNLVIKCINLSSKYLSDMQLGDVIKPSNITISSQSMANKLKLNSFVYDHLEIFNTSLGEKSNSFFDFINRTCTGFGSRMLRQWVSSPSTDLSVINSRLDVVEWLVENPQINNEIRRILSSCLDLERLIGSITNINSKRAIKFDHVQSNKLLSFHKLLVGFEPIETLRCLFSNSENSRLSMLLKFDNDGGSYPNIKPYITHFINQLEFIDKQCYPKKGLYDKYDNICADIDYINQQLNNELNNLSQSFNTSLKFVHSKFKFEIECLDSLQKKLSKTFEITSTRRGYIRFRTPTITTLVDQLQDLEFELWESVSQFFTIVMQEFKKCIPYFFRVIAIISEIDCLSTFAYLVLSNNYDMCKPKIFPMKGKPFFHLEKSVHPIIGLTVPDFIPNDICMNCHDETNVCLLLTGPNMGGKSTLLRQICLITIMAQIGCFVPAKKFDFTVVDKIYTRLGAYDSIMDGKSTFYIELEETSIMMEEASQYSLAMIDELGRGTSTFDGMAIASSSLFYIANKLKCRCVFSTHYHLICAEARMANSVSLYRMDYAIVDGVFKLLFRFAKGECHKSQGLNVAKLAGIPDQVLSIAQRIADSMESKARSDCSSSAFLSECLHLFKTGDLDRLRQVYREFNKPN